jgi:hypothetical protein
MFVHIIPYVLHASFALDMFIYIYIYIYIERERERDDDDEGMFFMTFVRRSLYP